MKKHRFVLLPLLLSTQVPAQVKSLVPKLEKSDLIEIVRTLIEGSYTTAWSPLEPQLRIERALAKVGDSPVAELLVDRWRSLQSAVEAKPLAWQRMTKLLDRNDLHGLARVTIRRSLARRLEDLGKFAEAEEMGPGDEYVQHALALGPFGDEGNHYHGVRYLPEYEELDVDRLYEGRFEKISFHMVTRSKGNTRLDLSPKTLSGRRIGCHYGIVQVRSDTETPAWLEIHCLGSFEAWWNGRQVASIDRTVAREAVRIHLPGVLRKGWNRILIKTTSSRTRSFTLRFTNERGDKLAGIIEENKKKLHPIAVAQPGEADRIPEPFLTASDWFETRLEAMGRPPILLAMLGILRSSVALETDIGLALVKDAAARQPDDLSIKALLLEAWRMARHVPADIRRRELRSLLTELDAAIFENRHLFRRKLDRLYADDKREDALELCEKRLQLHPGELSTLEFKYDILRRWRWTEEAQSVLDELLRLAPHSTKLILRKAASQERTGNPKLALTTIEAALTKEPGQRGLLTRALSLSRKVGDIARREMYLRRVYRKNKDSDMAKRAKATWFNDQGRHGEAVNLLTEISKNRPLDPTSLKDLADAEILAGQQESALLHYKKCLELDPQQHDLRRYVSRLEGKSDFPELAQWQLDGMRAALEYERRAEDADSRSTLVLDQMIIRVYEDGSQMEETHQLRRINDQKGVERYEEATAAAQAEELLELRTIHGDGSSYSPHLVSGSFSMPSLEPSAFIEERYRNFKGSPGAQPIDFVSFFFSGQNEPYRFSRLVVILPKGQRLGRFHTVNFPMSQVERKDLGDLEAWIFLKENMPRVIAERLMPPVDEIVPWVTFGKDRDIKTYVRLKRTSIDAMTKPWAEIRHAAANACKGLSDEGMKAKAIHDFVHAHTPDVSFRPGSGNAMSVLFKGEGDRFALQLAMLRSQGIKWTPVLIRPIPPEMDPKPEPLFNNPAFYSMLAAYVEPKGHAAFWILRGTSRYTPFAQLPSLLPNGNPIGGCHYLLLSGDSGQPGYMPGSSYQELATLKIDATLRIRGNEGKLIANATLQGPTGFAFKEQMRAQSRNVQERWARQMIAARQFNGFTVNKIEFPDLAEKGGPLKIRFWLSSSRILERRKNGYTLRPILPPSSLTRAFASRSSRKHPLVLPGYDMSHWRLSIDPGKHRFAKLPEGLLLRKMILDYGLSMEHRDGKLVIERRRILRPGRVAPERFAEFLDLCRQVDDLESQRIHFTN